MHVSGPINQTATKSSNADSTPAFCLEYAGCEIAVYVDDEATCTWLQEFLCPAFRLVGCRSPDWIVSLQIGVPTTHRRQSSDFSDGVSLAECFTRDGHFKCHDVMWRTQNSIVLRLEDGSVFVEIHQKKAVARVFAESGESRVRPTLMRVIREIATGHAIHSTHLPAHAAAIAYDDQAILFSGKRRSGKTTLALHALNDPQARFVCNDRGFVSMSAGSARIRGMPTILKIRPDSLQRLPSLRRSYQARPYHYGATIDESHCLFQQRGAPTSNEPLLEPRLSTSQLCFLLGRQAVEAVNLAAIMFPRIEPGVDSLRLQRISPDVATANLFREGLIKPTSPLRGPGAFCRNDAETVDDGELWDLCRRITANVPCYVCSLGPDAFRRPFCVEMHEQGVIARSNCETDR